MNPFTLLVPFAHVCRNPASKKKSPILFRTCHFLLKKEKMEHRQTETNKVHNPGKNFPLTSVSVSGCFAASSTFCLTASDSVNCLSSSCTGSALASVVAGGGMTLGSTRKLTEGWWCCCWSSAPFLSSSS